MAKQEDSAKIAELLVGAGLELNKLNKFGRSALAETVLSKNFGVMKVLVKAGAKTEGVGLRGRADLRAGLNRIRFEDKGEERKRKEVEAKKKEKKKLLDKAKTSLRTETKKMEEELAMLDIKSAKLTAELAQYKKEEEKKIQALKMKLADLKQDLDWKLAGRVKSEDVAKCLECPVCLDLCKPPKEVSLSHRYQFDTHLMNMLDLAMP